MSDRKIPVHFRELNRPVCYRQLPDREVTVYVRELDPLIHYRQFSVREVTVPLSETLQVITFGIQAWTSSYRAYPTHSSICAVLIQLENREDE